MIEKRHNSFVVSNGLVPVDTICNKIGQGRTIHMLQDIFPKLTQEDIFEAINFYAEHTSIPQIETHKLLEVTNTGNEENVIIEVTNLHQIVYIKLLSIAYDLYPEINDFAKLMNQGLRICTLENIRYFESNKMLDNEVNILVNEAMQIAVPDIVNDFESTKNDLDFTEYLKRIENNETKV